LLKARSFDSKTIINYLALGFVKGELTSGIVSLPNSPSRSWNNFCGKSGSLDRNEGNSFREIEDELKR
jgi:hypothetical protein